MPLIASLLTLGIGASLASIGRVRSFLLVAWLLATFVLGGVLTYDPPFWPHLIIALPAIMLLAAYGAETVLNTLAATNVARAVPLAHWVLACAIFLSGVEGWRIYNEFARANAGPRTVISRTMSRLPEGYTVYMLSDEFTPDMFIFRFYNHETPIKLLSPDDLTDSLAADAPRLFIIHRHPEALAQIQGMYPGGIAHTYSDRNGNELFVDYQLGPPSMPEAVGGTAALDWRLTLVFGLLVGWGARRMWENRTSAALAQLPSTRDS